MIIGKAAAMDGKIDANIKTVGTGYKGASGDLTFKTNGDVDGAGYDICTYSGDPADADKGYAVVSIGQPLAKFKLPHRFQIKL